MPPGRLIHWCVLAPVMLPYLAARTLQMVVYVFLVMVACAVAGAWRATTSIPATTWKAISLLLSTTASAQYVACMWCLGPIVRVHDYVVFSSLAIANYMSAPHASISHGLHDDSHRDVFVLP